MARASADEQALSGSFEQDGWQCWIDTENEKSCEAALKSLKGKAEHALRRERHRVETKNQQPGQRGGYYWQERANPVTAVYGMYGHEQKLSERVTLGNEAPNSAE